jgi:hypothetical protein
VIGGETIGVVARRVEPRTEYCHRVPLGIMKCSFPAGVNQYDSPTRHHGNAKRIADSMTAMAQDLHYNPQLESVLSNRTQQLGVGMQIDIGIRRQLMRYLRPSLGKAVRRK